ncbi:MAG: hypothetical protein RM338_32250 [Nostoc sp. DedQUE12a]|nr:hypothetical protein [Nostoc sp. DedQUE12a]
MTRTFSPESYGKLLAEYQPRIITTDAENEEAMSSTSRFASTHSH